MSRPWCYPPRPMGVTDMLRGLWRRFAYQAPDEGPGAAFARTVAAAWTGEGLEDVLDPSDAAEILARARGSKPRPLAYPHAGILEGPPERWFQVGLQLLAQALDERGVQEPRLTDLIGALVPRPGDATRNPVIEEILGEPAGAPGEAKAEVVYAYEGDVGTHRLWYYLDAEGCWQLDLVRGLVEAGRMTEALGAVQVPGCSNEGAFEV